MKIADRAFHISSDYWLPIVSKTCVHILLTMCIAYVTDFQLWIVKLFCLAKYQHAVLKGDY